MKQSKLPADAKIKSIISLLQNTVRVGAWVFLGLLAYMTLSPIDSRPHVSNVHFEHFAAYAILGSLFGLAYSDRKVGSFVVVCGGAIFLEVLQLLTPDRHAQVSDALEKVAGGVFGLVAASLLIYVARKRAELLKSR